MNGFSIKKIKNDYKKIDENIKSILFDTTYYKELPIYKSKFKTVIYKEKEEFKKYVNNSKITLGENIDEIYKNSFAIISTTSMSSEGTIFCNGIYQNNNDISINLKIETNETTNTNIITKGCIIILDKKYINYNFETVSETIIKK